MPNTWFVDFNNGIDNNNGTTFEQRVKTLSQAANLAVAGDTVRVMGNLPTTSGTATWTKGSPLVTLPVALTRTLYTDGRWTRASGQVACTNPTSNPSPRQGSDSAKNLCESTFTVGRIAYHDMGSSLDLSAYQQVTLWIQSDSAIAANELVLQLCSDNAGNVVVNSLPIKVALNAGRWACVTLDNGGALGTVRSLCLSAVNSGYMTNKAVFLDGIVACKAPTGIDCLTLNTLISPDGQQWYHIQSINGTSVYIDGQATTNAQQAVGYQGATGSYSLHLLKPTTIDLGASATFAETFGANGNSTSPIIISGGWDPSGMTLQTGWTSIDRVDWLASGLNLTSIFGYVRIEKFNFTRCAVSLGLADAKGWDVRISNFIGTSSFSAFPTHAMNVDQVNFINCTGTDAILNIPETANFNADGAAWTITNTNCFGCSVGGIKVPEFISSPSAKITGCNCSGNAGYGFDIQSVVDGFANNVARSNSSGGFRFKNLGGFAGYSLIAHGNSVSQVEVSNSFLELFGLDTNTPGGSALPQIKFVDDTAGRAVVYNWAQYTGSSPAKVIADLGNPATGSTVVLPQVHSQAENGGSGSNSQYSGKGTVTSTGVVGNGSSIGYRLNPNSHATAADPLRLKVATVACAASSGAMIGLFAKLSAASGISAQLRIEGGRYPGIGSPGVDVVTPISGIDYAQFKLPASPTEDSEVDVYIDVWGSTTLSATVSGPLSMV